MALESVFQLYMMDLISGTELDDYVEHYMNSERAPRFIRSCRGLFNLDSMTDDDILLNFRFCREDLPRLQRALQIPQEIVVREGCKVAGLTAVCILLRRLTYPNRLSDMEPMFGISGCFISSVVNFMVLHVSRNFSHLLEDLGSLEYLNRDKLDEFSRAVMRKGAPLSGCWAFIDGTARRICRPTMNQEVFYSGHKRFHCVKYQSILTPDGIVVSMLGAYAGRRHDAGIYRQSGIEHQLRRLNEPSQHYVLYGDPAYALSDVLISPYRGANISEQEQLFNSAMSKVRQAVEWGFQKITVLFAFLDFHKNQKIMLQEISKTYITATILTNCHTCLYGSQTSQYFRVEPPKLEEYLRTRQE